MNASRRSERSSPTSRTLQRRIRFVQGWLCVEVDVWLGTRQAWGRFLAGANRAEWHAIDAGPLVLGLRVLV